jgi:hypothetical protein
MAEHMAEWGMTSINEKYNDVTLPFGMKIPENNPPENKPQENKPQENKKPENKKPENKTPKE